MGPDSLCYLNTNHFFLIIELRFLTTKIFTVNVNIQIQSRHVYILGRLHIPIVGRREGVKRIVFTLASTFMPD